MEIILKTDNPVSTGPVAILQKLADCRNGREGSEVTYTLETWVYCCLLAEIQLDELCCPTDLGELDIINSSCSDFFAVVVVCIWML